MEYKEFIDTPKELLEYLKGQKTKQYLSKRQIINYFVLGGQELAIKKSEKFDKELLRLEAKNLFPFEGQYFIKGSKILREQ